MNFCNMLFVIERFGFWIRFVMVLSMFLRFFCLGCYIVVINIYFMVFWKNRCKSWLKSIVKDLGLLLGFLIKIEEWKSSLVLVFLFFFILLLICGVGIWFLLFILVLGVGIWCLLFVLVWGVFFSFVFRCWSRCLFSL